MTSSRSADEKITEAPQEQSLRKCSQTALAELKSSPRVGCSISSSLACRWMSESSRRCWLPPESMRAAVSGCAVRRKSAHASFLIEFTLSFTLLRKGQRQMFDQAQVRKKALFQPSRGQEADTGPAEKSLGLSAQIRTADFQQSFGHAGQPAQTAQHKLLAVAFQPGQADDFPGLDSQFHAFQGKFVTHKTAVLQPDHDLVPGREQGVAFLIERAACGPNMTSTRSFSS